MDNAACVAHQEVVRRVSELEVDMKDTKEDINKLGIKVNDLDKNSDVKMQKFETLLATFVASTEKISTTMDAITDTMNEMKLGFIEINNKIELSNRDIGQLRANVESMEGKFSRLESRDNISVVDTLKRYAIPIVLCVGMIILWLTQNGIPTP